MMESACIDLQFSSSWIILTEVLVVCASLGVWHWFRYQRTLGIEFFGSRPAGTDKFSIISWVFWLYACFSQFLPVGVLLRIFEARFSRLVLDLYIVIWCEIAVMALLVPDRIVVYIPILILRFWEYTAIAIYQRVFRAGFPPRLERRPEEFRLGYRALLVDVINYLTFATMFAALYHAHGEKFSPPITTVRDALYFSVSTMTTLGHGDILPLGCARWMVLVQVLFSFFMVAIILGVLIGRRILYTRE